MHRAIVFVFLLYHASVFSWNLSQESFARALDRELAPWMIEAIRNDFSPFKEKLNEQKITDCLQKLKERQGIDKAGLVRISWIGEESLATPLFPLGDEQTAHLQMFLSALAALHRMTPLPQLDLILCLNPSYDRPLLLMTTNVPIFAVSKENHNRKVVLIPRLWDPDRELLFHRLVYPWNLKIEKGFWRGSLSETNNGFFDWDFHPRARLALLSFHHRDLVDAYFSPANLSGYMANWLKNLSFLSDFVPPEQQSAYKYLLALDGKATPSCFEWQLFTNSLIFKMESNRKEWFYPGLVPGKHYVPIRPTLEDLIDKIMICKKNDEETASIAENAASFAFSHLLDEGAFLYFHSVLHKYAELF